jgi:hypothetical protein
VAGVTKGRITLLENPERIDSRYFLYNPTTISDNKSVNWGESNIAGASHPVMQFGSGGARVISFELFLDSIRSNIVRNGIADLTEELRWYRSLLYPTAYLSTTAKVSPPKIAFTFGTMWDGVICVVKKADIKVSHFSTKITPMKATVALDLQEVVSKSQIYSDVVIQQPNTPVGGSGGNWI